MIYFWGIGNDFYEFVKWESPVLDENVVLVDSAEDKIGTTVMNHIIQPPSCIKQCNDKDYIYITTVKYQDEIEGVIRKQNARINIFRNKKAAAWETKKGLIAALLSDDRGYTSATKEMINCWVEQALQNECTYWEETVPQYIAAHHEGLYQREFRYPFDWGIDFNEKDTIIDIGSGPIPIFGNLINGKEIDYRPLDPLAFRYSAINEKNGLHLPVETGFAIMEQLTSFEGRNTADYCIIHNALDHSIDILRAFTECYRTVRNGGAMLLAHLEAEAVHEGYKGLHQWNIEEKDGQLIFFNNQSYINVSELYADIAEIIVKRAPIEIEGWEYRNWILCKVLKKKDVPDEILWRYDAECYIAYMLESLFHKLQKV